MVEQVYDCIKMDKFVSAITWSYDQCIIFDIGSRDGIDAIFLRDNIPNSIVYAFEACPTEYLLHKDRVEKQNVNWFNLAIYNYDGSIVIHEKAIGSGIHSVRDRGQEYGNKTVTVPCMRVDTFCDKYNIKPNVVKIDVEGCSMEVLESFGSYLKYVDIFHVESEEIKYFKDQVLQKDVFEFLERNNFKQIMYSSLGNFKQHDSVWINLSRV